MKVPKLTMLKWLLIILCLINILLYIHKNLEGFTEKYDHASMAKIYSQSQYVLGPKALRSIGDDGLYAFAGYYYLMGKGDPSQVNFENPPLGKYLIGISILLFNNARVISIIYLFVLLIVVYNLAKIIADTKTAVLSLLLLSFSPLILDQISFNLLDLPMTVLLTLGIFFYCKALKKPGYFYLSSLFLSLSFVTKFFPGLFFLLLVLFLFLLPRGKNLYFIFLKSLIILPLVYLVSYAMYFYYHPSLIEFLRYQHWLISWRSGNPYIVGNILNSLFLGQYQSWWDPHSYITYYNWNILTPLIPFLAFISILLNKKPSTLRSGFFVPPCAPPSAESIDSVSPPAGGSRSWNKKNFEISLFWFLSFSYFLYVFFITTGIEKYLLPVYPLMTILAAYTLLTMSSIILRHGRNRLRSYQKKG